MVIIDHHGIRCRLHLTVAAEKEEDEKGRGHEPPPPNGNYNMLITAHRGAGKGTFMKLVVRYVLIGPQNLEILKS